MKKTSFRDAFFNRLYEIARNDRNVVLISADMGAPSLDKFRRELSAQFINVGIAEQNMVAIATGLSLSGKKVYIYAIMPFVSLRCYEFIKVNLSLMNLDVTVIGVGSGFSYNDSGPTHHATEDISAMRALPNLTLLNPSDPVMSARCAEISYELKGPCYVRLDREAMPSIYQEGKEFSEGIELVKAGNGLLIIATGNMVHQAFEVVKGLSRGSVDAGIIDLYRIKPINTELLLRLLENAKRIVTLEEHLLDGGAGSAVAEVLADNGITLPMKRIGLADRYYYAYGERSDIHSKCGLSVDVITKSILNWVKEAPEIKRAGADKRQSISL